MGGKGGPDEKCVWLRCVWCRGRRGWRWLELLGCASSSSALLLRAAPLCLGPAWRLARSSGSRDFSSTSGTAPVCPRRMSISAALRGLGSTQKSQNSGITCTRVSRVPGGRASKCSCSAPWGLTTESDVGTAAVCAKPRRFLRLAGTLEAPSSRHASSCSAEGERRQQRRRPVNCTRKHVRKRRP
jgi:hypothetical protein